MIQAFRFHTYAFPAARLETYFGWKSGPLMWTVILLVASWASGGDLPSTKAGQQCLAAINTKETLVVLLLGQ